MSGCYSWDGVWAMRGWLKKDLLISRNGNLDLGAIRKWRRDQSWYTFGVCVVKQVCVLT